MASSSTPNNHHHHQPPSTTATTTATTTTKKRKPPSSSAAAAGDALFPALAPADVAALNSTSSVITTEELLRRRLTLTRRLSRVYRHHFWALMEDLRSKYRLFYWKYGLSPFSRGGFNVDVDGGFENVPEDCGETNAAAANDGGNAGENGGGGGFGKLGLGFGENCNYQRCGYSGCKFKAMALTSFCYMHIMSDPHQKLYKPCNFVIKNTDQGQILCEKPILSSAAPSLCASHLPKIHTDVKQALKKAGLSASLSCRLAPKFHVVLAEYVKLIQSKRRVAQKRIKRTIVIKDESNC